MISLNRRVVTVALVVIALLNAAGCGRQSPEAATAVSGAWEFTIVSDQGTGTPAVTLRQAGETLTGEYSSTLFGEADLKGTLKGNVITFTVFAEWEGAQQGLNFTGEYNGSTAIKGTYSTSFGNGTFTAVRK